MGNINFNLRNVMKYTDSHEWIYIENSIGKVGVSAYAKRELGEIVYVELPKIGQEVTAGAEVAVLESTKAAADIYSPVSGRIVKVNEQVKKDVSLINTSPESTGWLYEIELHDLSELDQLLDQAAYQKLTF